eukprot:scaffold13664_cov89-Isochrysis_galbana.AAC.7
MDFPPATSRPSLPQVTLELDLSNSGDAFLAAQVRRCRAAPLPPSPQSFARLRPYPLSAPCPPLRPLQVLARVHSAGGDDSPTRSAGEAFRDCRLDGVLYTGADGGYGGDLPATGKLKLTYVCHKPLDEISCKARAAEAKFNLN